MLINYYEWIKALHVISVVAWMSGMLYLPRLFAYHTKVRIGSEQDKMFQQMEKRLLKIIINPGMLSSVIFGGLLIYLYGWKNLGIWFHIKFLSILGLIIFHVLFARWRKKFIEGKNRHSEKFYRFINEGPTVAMIVAIIMVIVKPFE